MAILREYGQCGRKIGRNTIKDALRGTEHPLSEAEVRGVLQVLDELGLVRSGLGRQGTELSPRGLQFLKMVAQ
jgi:repressor of nif and glnA expression